MNSTTILEPDSLSSSSASTIPRGNSPSFNGHGIFQVIIKDPSADSCAGEDINVRIEAKGEIDSSLSIVVPDTHEGSTRFEFFLIHANSGSIASCPTISIGA